MVVCKLKQCGNEPDWFPGGMKFCFTTIDGEARFQVSKTMMKGVGYNFPSHNTVVTYSIRDERQTRSIRQAQKRLFRPGKGGDQQKKPKMIHIYQHAHKLGMSRVLVNRYQRLGSSLEARIGWNVLSAGLSM